MPSFELYPYQKAGAAWLPTKRFALLADQMGLGKSAQVIAGADTIGARKILIVCPAIARLTWQDQFKLWSTLPRKTRVLMTKKDAPHVTDEVLFCSFDYASTEHQKLRTWRPDLLVADESHFLKSIEAKRTQAVLASHGIIHASKRTWFVTGTPMPNHPGELWPMLRSFGATDLNYDAFVHRFCEYYLFNNQRCVSGAKKARLPELRAMLEPIMLRRLTKDVLPDLPKVSIGDFYVEGDLDNLPQITDAQRNSLRNFQSMSVNQQIGALEVFAESIATLRRFAAMRKVKPVLELIKAELEARAYTKIVIFCVHKEVVTELMKGLNKFNPVSITGDTAMNQRQENIKRFQVDPNCGVFVGNIQAAGTNVTLTAAHHVMMLESSWVPGDNAQAIARCARIGQTMPVHVRVASIKNSIDDKVNEILYRKSKDIQMLVGA